MRHHRLAASAVFLSLLSCTYGLVTVYYNDSKSLFDDSPAAFGPDVPKAGVKGVIVSAEPDPFACEPILLEDPPVNFIVLAQRGPSEEPCTFEVKLRHAQAAGAAALIVYNNMNTGLLVMGGNGTGINIPAVFISLSSGLEIVSLMESANASESNVVGVIEKDKDSWDYSSHAGVALMAVISASFLLCLLCFGFYVVNNRRQPTLSMNWKGDTLEIEEVLCLPEIVIREDSPQKGEACSICLAEFNVGDSARLLPCQHTFHTACIIPWLTERNSTCPLCKHDMQVGTGAPLLRRDYSSDSLNDVPHDLRYDSLEDALFHTPRHSNAV